jgi:hypothetical protein
MRVGSRPPVARNCTGGLGEPLCFLSLAAKLLTHAAACPETGKKQGKVLTQA